MNKQEINKNVNEEDLQHTMNNILQLEKLFIKELKSIHEIEKKYLKY